MVGLLIQAYSFHQLLHGSRSMAERTVKAPPLWNSGKQSYNAFRQEVSLWAAHSGVKKIEQGWLLFNALPEEDLSGAREKVRLAIEAGSIDLGDERSAEAIVGVLDVWFKSDDLSELCDYWKLFIRCVRAPMESMSQFIMKFDQRYANLKRLNCPLPSGVLAMHFLDSAKTSESERRLVLTAVDYSRKDQLYQQMQSSLRKFFQDRPASVEGASSGVKFKEEPTYYTSEYVYLSQNY